MRLARGPAALAFRVAVAWAAAAALWSTAPLRICAEDVVHLASPGDSQAHTRTRGEVVEFNGVEIRVRNSAGKTMNFPASRVVLVETRQHPLRLEGDDRFAQRDFKAALARYEQALEPGAEERGWVRREIQARMVICLHNLGRAAAAGELFLVVLRGDPATPRYGAIPLAWTPAAASAELDQAVERWSTAPEPDGVVQSSMRLLAASHALLAQGEAAGARREAALGWLAALEHDADPRVAALARAIVVSSQIESISDQALAAWRESLAGVPAPLRAGSDFVLGRALAARGQHEDAALAFLRVPTLCADNEPLAAQCLFEAAEALSAAGQPREARTLLREVIAEHADSPAAAVARRRVGE